jgi:hypothetical protein
MVRKEGDVSITNIEIVGERREVRPSINNGLKVRAGGYLGMVGLVGSGMRMDERGGVTRASGNRVLLANNAEFAGETPGVRTRGMARGSAGISRGAGERWMAGNEEGGAEGEK